MNNSIIETPFSAWAIEQHQKTNHFYDEFIPYKFHLQMVANEAYKFIQQNNFIEDGIGVFIPFRSGVLVNAAWGHDLLEDTRVSYTDIVKASDKDTADIIYALTNEKGRNRQEKANEKYYELIKTTPGASFIKMCDRIANVKYGIMTDNTQMVKMYEKENDHFIKSIYTPDLALLRLKLNKLFELQG